MEAVRTEATAVLEKAFGDDGHKKRDDVLKLREAVLQLWQPGGASRIAAEKLLDTLQ